MDAKQGNAQKSKKGHKTPTILGPYDEFLFSIPLGKPLLVSFQWGGECRVQSKQIPWVLPLWECLTNSFYFSWLSRLFLLKFASSFLSIKMLVFRIPYFAMRKAHPRFRPKL